MLIILLSCFEGFSQYKLPNDWHLERLKGSPVSYTENTVLTTQNARFKMVFYYNKDGYLISRENYNYYHVEEDSLHLTERTTYKYPAVGIKTGITKNVKSKKNIGSSSYTMIAIDSMAVHLNQQNNITKMIYHLDEKQRIKLIEATMFNTKMDKEIANYTTEMTFENDMIIKMTVRNKRTDPEGNTLEVVNVLKDDKGNIIHKELKDNNGVIVNIVDRTYEYN
ncbi:hypothetical protein LX97_01976 [Nonlabens dokdonensis]|nr:hypothetical protein [Nonlabens dokdonensis]PZX39622.1 hypothetical protein LX97_01976 [Nonlabens dokdonensis]